LVVAASCAIMDPAASCWTYSAWSDASALTFFSRGDSRIFWKEITSVK